LFEFVRNLLECLVLAAFRSSVACKLQTHKIPTTVHFHYLFQFTLIYQTPTNIMSLATMNSSNLVDFSDTRVYQNDLEMEEILNEMGFFANDEFSDGFLGGDFPVTSNEVMPASFAPVSPDYHQMTERPVFYVSNPVISPSSSVEDMQNFSVPNPIAAMSSNFMPAPIAPKSSGVSPKNSQKICKKKTSKKESTKSRKRQAPADSTSQTVLKAPSSAFDMSMDDEGDLTEEQLEERRQRNREHAKRSRQRKKSLTSTLEQSVDDLKADNAKLRAQMYGMVGASKAESILESRRNKVRTQFMDGLMQPSSRVLDDNTASFLKGLRKGISSAASVSKKQKKN
jgi:hypothetical protein